MTKIIYKDIPGYEGIYKATSNGDIYALPRKWVTYRKGVQSRNGYFVSKVNIKGYIYTKLTNSDGIRKTWLVHRLIAISFIEKPENKNFINHINGVKSDNRVDNLEWCTHKENIIHSFSIGLGNIQVAIDAGKIKVFDTETNIIFSSMTEAAKSCGISRRYLSMMLHGERKNKTTLKLCNQ